ncbi:uncharacterized protein TrAFT101_008207 [Trichoderma asperellum]|uniref:Condensation domain-containing protein n=1 Tax=Trichoderma asperellum (strain ATCC 204424 / CBS 433.97 / NBRC 101777) TaxID=1042311 RepID=A0A2T3ZD18_TRIA4|nr:hypothetical protein M441DRAFT_137515 [Trichoderma asperellum CBS 433.97]PTB42705.1 hypothetical protein M441DRAFT_137515 [Trichoderma asperellum CBS 433.97]UKZ93288.1 hypothetical protein TrAFT101_008207 [Trichoderma asperellum]
MADPIGAKPGGIITRPLDANEKFVKWAATLGAPYDKTHFGLFQAHHLRLPSYIKDPVPYLQRTWLALRDRHPKFGAVFTPSSAGDAVTTDLGPYDHDNWLENTFFVNISIPEAHALLSSLKYTEIPLCYWLPVSQELAMYIPHWITDGTGFLILAHRFMTILVSVINEGLSKTLDSYASEQVSYETNGPSGDELTGYVDDDSTEAARLKEISQDLLAPFLQALPTIGLPLKPDGKSGLPGNASHIAISLESETTAAIVTECQKRGISVNSALHTSLIRITSRFAQHPAAQAYTSVLYINMRPHLPNPGPTLGASSLVAVLPIAVRGILPGTNGKPAKDWANLSAELNSIYRSVPEKKYQPRDGNSPQSVIDINGRLTRDVLTVFSSSPPPEMPDVRPFDYSSIGLVEKYLQRDYGVGDDKGRIEVLNVWKASIIATPSALCHGYTFRDRLAISVAYNDGYFSRDFMRKILQDIFIDIMHNLDITL